MQPVAVEELCLHLLIVAVHLRLQLCDPRDGLVQLIGVELRARCLARGLLLLLGRGFASLRCRRLGFGACLGRGPGTRLRRGPGFLLGRRLSSLLGTAGALSVLTRPVKDLLLIHLRKELREVLVVQGI